MSGGDSFSSRLSAAFGGLESRGQTGKSSDEERAAWTTKAEVKVESPRANLQHSRDGIFCPPAYDETAMNFALGAGTPRPAPETVVDEGDSEHGPASSSVTERSSANVRRGNGAWAGSPTPEVANRNVCFTFAQAGSCRFGTKCKFAHTTPGFARDPSKYTKVELDWSGTAPSNADAAADTFAQLAGRRQAADGAKHCVGDKITFVSKKERGKRDHRPVDAASTSTPRCPDASTAPEAGSEAASSDSTEPAMAKKQKRKDGKNRKKKAKANNSLLAFSDQDF